MKLTKTAIPGAVIIDLDIYQDDRGFFLETYSRRRYAELGLDVEFVQDNRSFSIRNVLRGLHYQVSHPQGHLIQVSHGEIFDVGLDLRKNSPTFGRWLGFHLNANKPQQLFLPAGIAHGFCTLSEHAEIYYKCTDYFYPEDEGGVLWNDREIKIDWPIDQPILKERDCKFRPLKEISKDELPQIQ